MDESKKGLRGALGAVSAFAAALVAAALALGALAACNDCLGSMRGSGERTLERRHERDDSFEQVEPEEKR